MSRLVPASNGVTVSLADNGGIMVTGTRLFPGAAHAARAALEAIRPTEGNLT